MPNFGSLAALEVAEKFVGGGVGWWVEHVTTVSNSNASFKSNQIDLLTMIRYLSIYSSLVFK